MIGQSSLVPVVSHLRISESVARSRSEARGFTRLRPIIRQTSESETETLRVPVLATLPQETIYNF
jgi:hypothetical protein